MRRYGAACLLAALCACAPPAGRTGGQTVRAGLAQNEGAHLSAPQMAQMRALIASAEAPSQQIGATAKMTRFGPEGRLRVTLQLVVQRPNRFRLTVLGPHGPPVYAAACDGAQLTALDVARKTLRAQPATPAGIAYHLGGLDVGLTAEDWVRLFFGEMAVPLDATAVYGPGPKSTASVTWRWAAGGRRVAAVFDGRTGVLQSATITLGDSQVGTLALKGRTGTGVVEHIVLHLAGGNKEPAQDVELSLVDVAQLNGPIADAAFVLAAPAVPSL